jgi:hypothetical protein
MLFALGDYHVPMRIRVPKHRRKIGGDPANHYSRLADDIGHNRRSYRAIDDGKPLGAAALLFQPLSLFLISLMALVLLCFQRSSPIAAQSSIAHRKAGF